MREDALERLLMDRSMGALSADTEEMLRAYLERDPRAAALAASLDQTANLARAALRQAPPAALPPFEAILRRSGGLSSNTLHGGPRVWRTVGMGLSLAACMLIGIRIGVWQSTDPDNVTPDAVVVNAPSQEDAGPADSTFWSPQRIYRRAAQPRPRDARHVVWETLDKPKIRGEI